MDSEIHGTVQDPARKHPVLDIRHWEQQFPIGDKRKQGGGIDGPGDVAYFEQARRLAKAHGDLGPSVPADVFVWADTVLSDRKWLTRLGGYPWRPKGLPWPKNPLGEPLTFLGQICFCDSKDIVPFELPGEVALFFGDWNAGWVSIEDGWAVEWHSSTLDDPVNLSSDIPRHGYLPFEYQGVIHRTVQHTDREKVDEPFRAAGFRDGWDIASVQATSVGRYASLPQGWPFTEGDGNSLVSTLSSFYFRGEWPLCDMPAAPVGVHPDGSSRILFNGYDALSFGIGDVGAMWVYRDKSGNFKLDEACG